MNTELNLSDPAVIAELRKHDVNAKPAAASAPVKEAIKEKQKSSSFTMKFSANELAILQRQAADAFTEDWKAYLITEIKTKILGASIGSPRISSPSWANRVSGPTNNPFT